MASISVTKANKSITLAPGEKFILPPNSTILSITGELDSTCDNLPEPQVLACYYFQWEMEGPGASGSDAWESGTVDEITVGTTSYTVNGDAYLENNDGASKLLLALTSAGFLDISIPAGSLLNNRMLWAACFKTTASIAASTVLKLHSGDDSYIQIPARLLSLASEPPCECATES